MLCYRSPETRQNEQGFLLLAVVIAVAVILILLAVAAPRMAKQLERDKEEESVHRAEQYERAIQLYYRSVNTYPTSIDQLMNTNNRKFLRQKYKDPLTGDDYRLIHLGEQKTKIKWFFGKSMDEIMPGGLSGMAGMGSPIGGSPGIAGSSTPGQSIGGAPGTPGSPTTPGAPSQTASSPFSSNDATTFQGSAGPIIGVGTKKKGDAIVEWNGSKKMQDWEFLYDPRPDMIRNQVSLFGGSPAVGAGMQGGSMGGTPIGGGSMGSSGPMGGAPSTGGFGSSSGSSSPFGGSSGSGFGSSPFGGSSGSGFGSSPFGSSGSSTTSGSTSGTTGNGASTPPQ